MEISKDVFFKAAKNSGIDPDKANALWLNLQKEKPPLLSKWLYYLGAALIILAMMWLMTISWDWLEGGGLFIIATLYALLFIWLGKKLWQKKDLKIPAGLLISAGVCMTPIAIYGLETYLGISPQFNNPNSPDLYQKFSKSWVFMEVGTIFAGLIALFYFRFSFIAAPICFAAWFLLMDATSWFFTENTPWRIHELVSLCFGIAMLILAYRIDRKNTQDYSFWIYLVGAIIFWLSLTQILTAEGELMFFFYFLLNIALMIAFLFVDRVILMILGAVGSFFYLGHLAYNIFQDSIWFPFALSFIGLGMIYLGIFCQKNSLKIRRFFKKP